MITGSFDYLNTVKVFLVDIILITGLTFANVKVKHRIKMSCSLTNMYQSNPKQ